MTMKGEKHTPGPWHWDSDVVKDDPTHRVRYRVCARGKTVTQIYHSSFEGGPTCAEADAKLIASAPDLLEALQRIVDGGYHSTILGKKEHAANCAPCIAMKALSKVQP